MAHTDPHDPKRRPRAFSLIEVMVVVALISIIAAIAVPNLLPEVQKAHLDTSSESTLAFLARARAEAMLSKRCVRVWVDSNNPQRMVSERLNSFDCDATPGTFAAGFGGVGLDGTANVWSPIANLLLDSPQVALSLFDAPANTTACDATTGSVAGTPAGFPCDHIIFRPNGRLHAVNTTLDDAVIRLTHTRSGMTKNILINTNGLICAYPRNQALIAGTVAGDFVCPP